MYKRLLLPLLLLLPLMTAAQGRRPQAEGAAFCAGSQVFSPQVKSLQAVVNRDWLSPLAVMRLGTDDVLNIAFDELSHEYHRYVYRLEHCEADWSPSEELFESDWLEGFNGNTVDDYETSINTTVAYTHYRLQIPNDRCRLKISGNYRLHIADEDDDDEGEVLTVEFMVAEQAMNLGLGVTTNTDIDTNVSHQQVSMTLNYGSARVTNPAEQIRTVVMQNGREARWNVKANFVNGNSLEWTHNRSLIFDAGNEYRKYEILDVSHTTLGLDRIHWDGEHYQAFPFAAGPRPNYIYDKDANGAFYIRNSDNRENDTACDYVWVNYRLQTAAELPEGSIVVDGQWTTDHDPAAYTLDYDPSRGLYTGRILQKQGYYSYRFLWRHADGSLTILPSEGNFYQTENSYQALAYYRAAGSSTWRLVAYSQADLE